MLGIELQKDVQNDNATWKICKCDEEIVQNDRSQECETVVNDTSSEEILGNAEEETNLEEKPFSSDNSIADPNYLSDASSTSSEERAPLMVLQDEIREVNTENNNTCQKMSRIDVRAHIGFLPKIESHYRRVHSEKGNIASEKTITDLYGSLREKSEEKEVVGENYLTQQREKKLGREEKQTDKEKINKKYQVSCFDLQAVLPTPRGGISTFYYKSKLSTYNFTVGDHTKKGQGSVTCFMWHEGQRKRGPNEIGSCLLKYLKQKSETYKGDDLEISAVIGVGGIDIDDDDNQAADAERRVGICMEKFKNLWIEKRSPGVVSQRSSRDTWVLKTGRSEETITIGTEDIWRNQKERSVKKKNEP
ncbi:hypothetical protein ILUMI_10551 [Ignelater luminosus]|uniref:Uncharacterized protein n=1 Tax=Ignelater luminosus TaxID=2038154 RepID=A0A8K0CXN5_IGNLU|nr:hypothetical protein ILUMI_10551 [Ignelater luminosus]